MPKIKPGGIKMLRKKTKAGKDGTNNLEKQKAANSLTEELDIATLNEKLGDELSLEQIQKKITFHTKSVMSVAVTSDSRFCISVGEDSKVGIFETITSELKHEFTFKELGCIKDVSIDDNDKYVAICGSLSKIATFDFQKREHVSTLHILDEELCCIIITPDGSTIATGTSTGKIFIVDRKKNAIIHVFEKAHKEYILGMTVSKDQRLLYTGSCDKAIGIFDINSKTKIDCLNFIHSNSIFSLKIINDDKKIVSCGADKCVAITDLETRTVLKKFDQAHASIVLKVAAISSEHFLVSIGRDGNICIYDAVKLQHIHSFEKVHQGWARGLAVSKDNRYIISCAEDKVLSLIDLGREQKIAENCYDFEDWVTCVSSTKDSQNWVAAGSRDGKIVIYWMPNKKPIHSFPKAHIGGVSAVTFSSSDEILYSGGERGDVKIWNMVAEHSGLSHNFEYIHKSKVKVIRELKTRDRIVTAAQDGTISIIGLKEKLIVSSYSPLDAPMITMELSASNEWFAISTNKEQYRLWNFENQKEIWNMDHIHEDWVMGIAITPNDRYLISCSCDRSICILDVDNRSIYHRFIDAHQDWILTAFVAKDSRFFWTGSTDKTIGVFDILLKVKIHKYENLHTDSINCVILSQDALTIVTGSKDNTVGMNRNMINSKKAIVSVNHFFNSKEENLIYKKMMFKRITSLILRKEVQKACELIAEYPDLKVMPSGANLFHVCSMLEANSSLYISTCIESKVRYVPDRSQKTPIHYLMSSTARDPARINALLSESEYLFDKSRCPDHYLRYLSNTFFEILALDNQNVVLFLNSLLETAPMSVLSFIPSFGKLKSSTGWLYTFSDTPVPEKETFKDIIPRIDPNGNRMINVRYFRIPLDLRPHSVHMLKLMELLQAAKNEEIFLTRAVKAFIDYGWRISRRFILTISVFYGISIVFFSGYALLLDHFPGIEITDFIMAAILFLYEVVQFVGCYKAYIQDFWNAIDVLAASTRLAVHILYWTNAEEAVRGWIISFALLFGYFKLISCFRLFKSTRKIVRMIVEIIADLRSFFLVLVFLIIGFSLILYQYADTSYGEQLLTTYNIMYLQYDVSEYNFAQIFFFVIITALLSTVLLNMIIAVMNDTFNRVQGRRALSDGKEKVFLIMENFIMQKIYYEMCKCRKRIPSSQKEDCSTGRYLFFVDQGSKEDHKSDTHALTAAIKGIQKDLKAQIKLQTRLEERQITIEEKTERDSTKLLKRQSEFENKILERIENLQNNMSQLISQFPMYDTQKANKKNYDKLKINNSMKQNEKERKNEFNTSAPLVFTTQKELIDEEEILIISSQDGVSFHDDKELTSYLG